jgi:short-subunit dehydrogenase
MAIPAPRAGAAALITGASSGIGAELARGLSARGHDTILVARRRDRLQKLAAELAAGGARRSEVLAADVSERAGRELLLDGIRSLGLEVDVLVPSAGFGLGGAFIREDPARIELMIRTNVEASFALTRALAPAMAARRSGAVLLVSSFAGNQPMPHFAAYAATKAAITSLAESLHYELGRHGVTVSALCPGGVRTEFSDVADMTEAAKRMPGALMIGPEEVARTALEGLERGDRIIMPRRAVRAFAWFGDHIPRRLWLPLCARMLG